jgi:hypothetical protein
MEQECCPYSWRSSEAVSADFSEPGRALPLGQCQRSSSRTQDARAEEGHGGIRKGHEVPRTHRAGRRRKQWASHCVSFFSSRVFNLEFHFKINKRGL